MRGEEIGEERRAVEEKRGEMRGEINEERGERGEERGERKGENNPAVLSVTLEITGFPPSPPSAFSLYFFC